MHRRPRALLPLLGFFSLFLGVSPAFGDEPSTVVLTASDLAGSFKVPADGSYTVKVWSHASLRWTLDARGQSLTLASKVDGDDARGVWTTLGTAQLKAAEPVSVVGKSDMPAPKPAAKKAAETPPPPPLPAVLVLSTDPRSEPAGLAILRGNLKTAEPSDDDRRTTIRTNRQGVDFKAPASAREWHDRARAVREQLWVTNGLWPLFPRTDLHPRVEGKATRDGYTIEKVVLETFPGYYMSGNLYRPIGKAGKLPGILSPHGHYPEGRVNEDVQARCIRWAKLGAVVFMYDMVGYADSKPFGHVFLNDRLRRWGLSLVTLQTWNSIRALDWLQTLADVDPARIGCTGESGGGTQTFLLTAIEPRIKVAAPVVMVSHEFQGGCVCENAAGLRLGTDNVEFAALAAPRPMKMVGATGDWTKFTMSRAYPAISEVYRLVGKPENVSAEVFNFNHNYNQTSRNAIYPFMARWLMGIDDADSTKEGHQTPETPEDLFTFNAKAPAPSDFKTAAQLETSLIGVLGREIDKLGPTTVSETWEAARSLLGTSLRIRVGAVEPAAAELVEKEGTRDVKDGLTTVHAMVGRKGHGDRIPVVRLIPKNATGRATLVFSSRGKGGLLDAAGGLSPVVKALLAKGQSVIGFDPFLAGESLDAASPRRSRPETVHFDCYNPTLAQDRAQDLATVATWARFQPDVRELSLISSGTAAPLALVTRPLLTGLARTAIDLDGFDYGDGSGEIPAEIDLPGALQFGGLKSAASLTSPAPLWLARPATGFAKAWPTKSYALGDVAAQLKIDDAAPEAEALAKWIDLGE